MTEQDAHYSLSSIAPEDDFTSEGLGIAFAVSVVETLALLARRKWLIAKLTGIAIFVGIVTSLLLPVRYMATTKILTPQRAESSVALLMSELATPGARSLASVAGSGIGLRTPNDTYIGMLQSRPVTDALIEQFALRAAYKAKDMTAARAALAEHTKIDAERSGFLAVTVTDRDKNRAAAMANAYIEQLQKLTKSLAVTEASQRRLFYEEQLKRAKDSLVNAEFAFLRVQQQKGLVRPDAQATAMIDTLAGLHAQIGAKQVELRALRSFSTDRNPDVELAKNQLSSLQAEAAQLEEHNRSSLPLNIGMEDVPGASLEYLRAEHEVRYQQTLYDLLLKQYDAARLDEAKEGDIIQVVEQAIPPDRKSSPHRVATILTFLIVGLLGSCLYVYVFQRVRNDRLLAKSLSEFRSALFGR